MRPWLETEPIRAVAGRCRTGVPQLQFGADADARAARRRLARRRRHSPFINSRSPHDDRSCADPGLWCFTVKDNANLLFIAILVLLGASLPAALLVAVPLSRRFTSALAAGTVSALVGSNPRAGLSLRAVMA